MMDEHSFTETQQRLLAWGPRVMAMISFASAGYMVITILVLRRKEYMQRLYHRIMLGTAFNIMVWSTCQLWGVAAVPQGTIGVSGARGNETTCAIQGFFNQLGFVVPIYYCCLSIYSYFAVRNNFHPIRYAWIEPCIHIGVYIYPILSGVYLLLANAFHYSGHTCWIASHPIGCGGNPTAIDYVPCTKGPENIGQLQWIFAGIPTMVVLILPSLVMLSLYLSVLTNNYKQQQQQQQQQQQAQQQQQQQQAQQQNDQKLESTMTMTEMSCTMIDTPPSQSQERQTIQHDAPNCSEHESQEESSSSSIQIASNSFVTENRPGAGIVDRSSSSSSKTTTTTTMTTTVIYMDAKVVARQSLLYLSALYFSYLFAFINTGILFVTGETYFSLQLLASCIEVGMGLWILLAYRYFCNASVVTNGDNRNNNNNKKRKHKQDSDRKSQRRQTSQLTLYTLPSFFLQSSKRAPNLKFLSSIDDDDDDDDCHDKKFHHDDIEDQSMDDTASDSWERRRRKNSQAIIDKESKLMYQNAGHKMLKLKNLPSSSDAMAMISPTGIDSNDTDTTTTTINKSDRNVDGVNASNNSHFHVQQNDENEAGEAPSSTDRIKTARDMEEDCDATVEPSSLSTLHEPATPMPSSGTRNNYGGAVGTSSSSPYNLEENPEHEIVFYSIFDGTNAASKSTWSQYIYEGDSEDEENDLYESYQWDGVLQP